MLSWMDYRMSRCLLKGFAGDQINLAMAAAAWNLNKWLRLFLALLASALPKHHFAAQTGCCLRKLNIPFSALAT